MTDFPDPRTEYIQTKIGQRELAKKWEYNYSKIKQQCKREGWVNLRSQFIRKRDAKLEETAIQTIAQMNAEHLKILRGAMMLNLKDVQNLENKTRGEATRAAIEALKTIRTIRGEPDSRTEHVAGIRIQWGPATKEE